jgi:4-methyl-5(b-hydroxyethyl)-thiazole monophosphate biosynthesis
MNTRALVILHSGFEEIEAVTPIDLLTRAGVKVVQAALSERLEVTGKNGIVLQASHHLDDVVSEPFDAVILPGGPGIQKIRKHPIICKLFKQQKAANRIIGCICAAPLLLLDAGLIANLRYTCYPSVRDELPEALEDRVVQDGTIITSRGAGTATEFGLQIVRALTDKTTANKIAASICWTR